MRKEFGLIHYAISDTCKFVFAIILIALLLVTVSFIIGSFQTQSWGWILFWIAFSLCAFFAYVQERKNMAYLQRQKRNI